MALVNANRRMSKSDAQTVAQGEQLSGDIEKRLRSASGKIYHAEINVQAESQSRARDKMGSIEEILEKGGIDHAEATQAKPGTQHVDGDLPTPATCCEGSGQIIQLIGKLQDSINSMDAKLTASSAFQENTKNVCLNWKNNTFKERKRWDT